MVAQSVRTWSRPTRCFVRANAAEAVKRFIDRAEDGSFTYELDSGARVAVHIKLTAWHADAYRLRRYERTDW